MNVTFLDHVTGYKNSWTTDDLEEDIIGNIHIWTSNLAVGLIDNKHIWTTNFVEIGCSNVFITSNTHTQSCTIWEPTHAPSLIF